MKGRGFPFFPNGGVDRALKEASIDDCEHVHVAMPTVGIIGAGIAGLAAAHRLEKNGTAVHVFEASDRTGGVIHSQKTEGFLVEHGPNSIRTGAEALETVIDELDLHEERVWAHDTADTRYVVRDGRPISLPTSVGSFLSTDLFSAWAKLRLLAEPFIGRPDELDDESVAEFTRRRLGSEVLDYAVAPFVGGVFAGTPKTLSVRHAFRRLAQLEDEYGSLFLGAVREALSGEDSDDKNVPSGLFSFRNGLQTLPDALADTLGNCITLDAPVTRIERTGEQWQIGVDHKDEERVQTFDALLCTVPLHRLGTIDFTTSVNLAPLTNVSYPPLSVLALGYPRDAVEHPLDGFGMLVPPVEDDLNILGTIFSSTLFPDRAPDDHVLLTTFVGGARAPDRATLDSSALQSVVESDLDRLLGVAGTPVFQRHVHWPNAIPQYNIGYGAVTETLDELERQHPRLAFAGNYRQGVSVGDALTSGVEAAHRLLDRFPIRESAQK